MDAWHRYVLACSILRRGLIMRDRADDTGAAADARRALELCDGPPPRLVLEFFEAACCHATLAGLAGRAGSEVPAAEREEEAARAMESLRRAIALGYRNVHALQLEPALDPLRSRADFQLMMMDVEMPDEAFAPGR
jgi:hypothetical protein